LIKKFFHSLITAEFAEQF